MNVWLVVPARGRLPVTRLCFQGLTWLRGMLAARGITANVLCVADDENVNVAAEHGFDVLEVAEPLGRKVNAGFAHALQHNPDYVAFSGSDDWLHPDLFEGLDGERVRAGRKLAVVDVERGRLMEVTTQKQSQAVPWLIPAKHVPAVPLMDKLIRGADFMLRQKLPDVRTWDMHDPHPLCRVDFKTADNLTPYAGYAHLARGEVDAWPQLEQRYPVYLAALAASASAAMQQVAA